MTRLEEIAIKVERLHKLMEAEKLDAIYLKRQDDFSWITAGGRNYVALGEMGNCGILVTSKEIYAVTNTVEARRMKDEEKLEEFCSGIRVHPWHDSSGEGAIIKELVPSGFIGADYGAPFASRNVATAVKNLRASLTESEAERYRELGYLASVALEETASRLRPGNTEYDSVSIMSRILAENGMEMASMMCAADDRISLYRHPVPTMRRIGKRVQVGGNFRKYGLTVCMSRFVHFEKVSEELEKQYLVNQQIDLSIMEATRPGRLLCEVLEDARRLYADYGYAEEFEKHHQGGPIGYAPRDYRVDFTHRIPVAENQAFCWNPSITGTKSEDTILVNNDGFEFITGPVIFPSREITVNGHTYRRAAPLLKYQHI